MTTGYVFHPDCVAHDAGPQHPERPGRLVAIRDRLQSGGLLAELDALLPDEADPDAVATVHGDAHVAAVRAVCAEAPAMIDGDTAVSKASFRAAMLAAGGVVAAAERVADGTWSNAFCALRPPGHHAEKTRAMGFCLFNSIAVAATRLRARGFERVAILDWDVHHGNGTQHLFEEDPSVFYASLHQWPLYPGTGAAEERGRGAGEGATLNCPMEIGAGDAEWRAALEERVLPALDAFAPDFVLVSAGFDAHRLDPLASTNLTTAGYAAMTSAVVDFAASHCAGRLVSMLEGGYHLDALAESVEAHVSVLREAAR